MPPEPEDRKIETGVFSGLLRKPVGKAPDVGRLACSILAALCLSGCGVVSTAVVVTSAAVGVATTAASVAVDGAVLVGKGVVKTGAAVVDAVSDDDEKTQ